MATADKNVFVSYRFTDLDNRRGGWASAIVKCPKPIKDGHDLRRLEKELEASYRENVTVVIVSLTELPIR